MTPTPLAVRRRMASNRICVSCSPIAEVGSSMMRMRALRLMARAISTSWVCASESCAIFRAASTSKCSSASSWRALRSIAAWSTRPPPRRGSRPRKIFSAAVMSGTGESSCVMMAMLSANASVGERKLTSRPWMRTVPSSLWSRPMRMFRKVDLPAPLPPQSASTSPAASVTSPLTRAGTPSKDLETPRASTRIWVMTNLRSTEGDQLAR